MRVCVRLFHDHPSFLASFLSLSFFSLLSFALLRYERTCATFSTCATRCAKRHVEILSPVLRSSALHVATIDVSQLPPKLSLSTDVSIEFRNGTCREFPFRVRSWRATMTISRK